MPSSETLLRNPGALCNMVRRVAVEAGHITLKYFDGEIAQDILEKEDGSPVTLADREAEKFIIAALGEITPELPVVAEEAFEKGQTVDLTNHDYFWLVDPLDGTKEFIAGGENYTVNIGLICNGRPVLGVIYAPALGILYAGHGEGTAMRWGEETGKDKQIKVRQAPAAGLTVMSSMNHADDAGMEKFLQGFKVEKILKRASSIKICMVAEGRADIYPRLGPTYEWDTAAGEAILRAAGGMLTDMQGRPLNYGGFSNKLLNPDFVVSAFEWFEKEED